MIGFSEHVDLGEVGVLRDDPTIALRFEVTDLPDPPPTRLTLRLRGTAFDSYDGRAWARTQRDLRPADHGADGNDVYPLFRGPDPARDRAVTFDLEPIDPPVLFLPPRAVALRVRPQAQALLGEPLIIQRGADEELRYAGSDARGLRYDVYLAGEAEKSHGASRGGRSRAVPRLPGEAPAAHRRSRAQLDGRLCDRRTPKHAPSKSTCATSSATTCARPRKAKQQPVDDFLFESKRGHCEFFSTAMALMLRAVGIPSRNVTGFVGGTWNRFGHYYAVREGDAHSWVEAYIDDPAQPRWMTFDPTPLGRPAARTGRAGLLLHSRFRRGAVAALEHVRRRLRSPPTGSPLRRP